MATTHAAIIDLEKKFWQSMVDEDTDTALELLSEPALMVSDHGAMKFDHAGYRQMAEQGSMVVTGFTLSNEQVVFAGDDTAVLTYHVTQEIQSRSDGKKIRQEMNDSSTWVRHPGGWRCVIHTETPSATKPAA